MTEIVVGDVVLHLTPEGAVFWKPEKVLFVADLHLGKDADFRRNGISVPTGVDERTYHILDQMVDQLGVQHLVVLGDVWHSAAASRGAAGERLALWVSSSSCRVDLVLGNHDRGAVAPQGVSVRSEGSSFGPFTICHHPPDDADTVTLCGHVHPVVAIDRKRVKCFWLRGHLMVLPAFGGFTGGHNISRKPGDKFVCTGTTVRRVPDRLIETS